MHKHIHSSLSYLTPVEFEIHWLTQQHFLNTVIHNTPISLPNNGFTI